MIEQWGNYGYQIGALGIVLFTIVFLITVPWWSDLLGRLIALVVFSMTVVLVVSTLRMMEVELPGGIFWWRLIVYWTFGLSVWVALVTFIWVQFLAPRIKVKYMTTRRKGRHDEEADLADRSNSSDGDLYGRSGVVE